MMKVIVSVMMSLLLFTACKSSDPVVSSEMALKTLALVEAGNYEIVMISANPMVTNELNQLGNANLLPAGSHAGEINLRGNHNFIRKKGDSVEVYLPYFGTRYSGVSITNHSGGIKFKGEPKNYRTSFDEKKQRTRINFDMKEDSESYDVSIEIYPSKLADVNINSTQRSSISYDGTLVALKEE